MSYLPHPFFARPIRDFTFWATSVFNIFVCTTNLKSLADMWWEALDWLPSVVERLNSIQDNVQTTKFCTRHFTSIIPDYDQYLNMTFYVYYEFSGGPKLTVFWCYYPDCLANLGCVVTGQLRKFRATSNVRRKFQQSPSPLLYQRLSSSYPSIQTTLYNSAHSFTGADNHYSNSWHNVRMAD